MASDPPVLDIQQVSRPLLSGIYQHAINFEPLNQPIPTLNNVCPICLETYSQQEFLDLLPCRHSFCTHCIQNYITEQINNLKLLTINCPQDGCQAYFPNKIIKQVLDQNTYAAYENLASTKLAALENNQYLCPVPGCAHDYDISTQFPYTLCSRGKTCNTCRNCWHEGETCLENVDNEFRIYASQHDIKFCPVCKTAVSQTDGCKKITCPVCDYQWCWDCGNQFSTQHTSTCENLWNPNPPTRPRPMKRSLIREKWAKKSRSQKTIIVLGLIILFPIWFSILLVSWGLIIYILENKKYSCRAKPIKSFFIAVLYIALSILTSPLVLILILLWILIMPCIIGGAYLDKRKQAKYRRENGLPPPERALDQEIKDARWLTGDPQNFKLKAL